MITQKPCKAKAGNANKSKQRFDYYEWNIAISEVSAVSVPAALARIAFFSPRSSGMQSITMWDLATVRKSVDVNSLNGSCAETARQT